MNGKCDQKVHCGWREREYVCIDRAVGLVSCFIHYLMEWRSSLTMFFIKKLLCLQKKRDNYYANRRRSS